jgi:hypothetical protein
MTISDKIGNSHVEAMKKILAFINAFNVHKLLYAISEKSLDEEDVVSITLDIREYNVKLQRQKVFLFDYTKTVNKKYALEDNKLLDTSARLTHRMRSGIRGIRKTIKSFCKKSMQRLRPGQKEPQAIDRSLIATEAYMRDLFGLESYPECVKELFVEIMSFFNNMNACLEEAHRSLAEEKETRGDKLRCLELLVEACEKCRSQQEFILEAAKNDQSLKAALLNSKDLQPNSENPVLNAYVNSEENKETFASEFFHNCSPRDVSKIAFYKTMMEAEGDTNLMACMALFGCDKEKARQINYAISHFDSLLPERCKRNKIPAVHLYVFKQWCGGGIGNDTFLNYFNKHYKEAGGQRETIGKSALAGVSTRALYENEKIEVVKRTMLIKLSKMQPTEHTNYEN